VVSEVSEVSDPPLLFLPPSLFSFYPPLYFISDRIESVRRGPEEDAGKKEKRKTTDFTD
jgi:hypothetical protein